MTDVAAVGIAVETDGLDKGIKKLAELAQQGPKVEQSMAGISGEAKKVAKNLAELGAGAGDGLKKTGEAAKQAATGIKASSAAAREAVTDTESLRRSLSSLTGEEERFVKSLEKQYAAMTMGRGDFEAYIAAQKGMGTGAQEVARAIGNKIDALKTEQAELAKSKSAMDEVIAGAKNLALSLAGGALFKKFITETVNAQQEQAQLAAVLKSTGEAAGWSQQKLNDMAASMSKASTFSAGEINQAQARLLGYIHITGEQLPRAMQSVIDMSTRMGMSVTQAAETVGKALDVPSEGLTALTKQGFRFTEMQKALVEQFEDTGDAAKAQGIIMDSMGEVYEGAAAAARNTLGGALKALQNSFNDVMTGDSGSAKGMQESIESLNRTLSSDATRAGFQTVISSIAKIVEVASTGISVLGQFANAASLSGKVAQHGQYERQFDYAKGQLDRLQPRLRLDPNNEELKAEAKELRDAMTRAHKAMQDATAGIASVAGVGSPAIDAPAVIASTKALEGQGIVLGKTAEWIRSYGTAVEKADLAVKEWRKQLGDGLTADMEAQIRAGFKEKGGSSKGVGQQEKAISDIRARILAEEELIKRIQEHGAAAQGLSESDKLVGKLQEEIAGTTNKRTKASLEGQLAEALVWQETQKHRTELEKLAKTQDEGEKSYRKYIDSLYKSADVLGDMADKQNAANASFGKSKVAIAEMAAEQAKLAFLNAKDMGPWTPEQIAALKALTDQHDKYVKSLREAEFLSANRKYDDAIKAAKYELELQQYGMSLLGQEDLKRNKLIAARKAEIKLAKELLDIEKQYKGRTDDESVKQRTELESKARIQAEEELQGELSRIQNQYITEQVNKYGDIFRQGFADFVNNGTDGLKAFGKSLKTTILTSVADALYKAFAQKFVVNVVASLSGGGGWVDSLLGLVGVAGGSGGGGSNAMSLFSNGKTAYDMYTGNGVYGQALNYGKGLLGYGGTSPWVGAGAQASGAATTPVTGGLGGAAPGSSSWLSSVNWGAAAAMAIPFIAAYLGGMFKEERMVGQGLTGDLGGDMYGYQLMRESGGLFDGPNYRYLVAEKEVAEAKARIAELQTGKPYAELGEKGDALRERELQRLYSRLDMLEREYSGAIDGSKGPIKIIQDAFQGMREGTAFKADSLGLDGDSIRAMKVALGLDEIHPDTGGKGLQLTGLTQEEASAKIQQALNQANEELARSVLGSWEEQTREIPRVIFDQVSLGDGGGDTEQFGRVGREVTETITEQVFVMSEFVREGETAVQALDRLSGSLLTANQFFDLLGETLFDTSLAGADLASDLMDAFGGADKFNAAAGNYYDKMFSDQEKVANQTRLLNAELNKLGIDTMPASREALREYISGLDLTTEEGQKLYASLLGLVDVFDMIYSSAENIAALKGDLGIQLLRAQGNDEEATRLEREKQIKELQKYNDPELVAKQREVWAAEDAKKARETAEQEAKAAAEAAKSLAMGNLQAAIGREKEYWSQFSSDAKDALQKASSYLSLVTGAASSLRGSVADTSGWAAAAGMVYIEQAVAQARKGLGLSDYDKTKSAIDAATGGLVMDKYATQAELDYDKKVLAGQFDELGGYAELAKSDAQKQIDLATAQLKGLDDTLKFWQEYGKEQVSATMSVTDAVNALYLLLDPKEQARIKAEEAEKAGLTGGAPPTYTGGGALGGSITGSNRVTVIGLTADGRAIYSDGTTGKTAAGEYTYNETGSMNSHGYSLAEFERFKTSGEFEWDAAKNQWVKRKSFAVGTNFVPRDMTANIHQGERIIPAADNRALMAALQNQGSGGNAELLSAVNRLEQRLAAIEKSTAGSNEEAYKLRASFDQVTDNGNLMHVNVTNRALAVRTS